MLANKLVGGALDEGRITELAGYETRSSEVAYGKKNSRIDWLLDEPGGKCYVEVKNVTLALDSSIAVFPDAVTTRGHKHLRELAAIA